MANEIAKYDPNKWQEELRGRVRAAILDTIPQEQIDALINAEVDAYLRERAETDHYRNPTGRNTSGLLTLVRGELESFMRARVKSVLDDPAWSTSWDHKAGDRLIEGLKAHAGTILDGLVVRLIGEALTAMRAAGRNF